MNVTEQMPLARRIARQFPGDDEAESEAYLVLCELADGDHTEAYVAQTIRNRLRDRRRRRLAEYQAGLAGGCASGGKLVAERPSLYERLAKGADLDTAVMLARWAEGRTWKEIQTEFYPDRSVDAVKKEWSKRLADLAAEVQAACQ